MHTNTDPRDARIAALEGRLTMVIASSTEIGRERDQLRLQVKRTEDAGQAVIDQLRAQLERTEKDSNDQIEHLKSVSTKRKFEIAELKEQLKAVTAELATYKQPKLVNSVWHNIYPDGDLYGYYDRDRALAELDTEAGAHLLRWDTYQNADGSTYVVATLEPVTEESK